MKLLSEAEMAKHGWQRISDEPQIASDPKAGS
jgi:hypothetical protein